MSELAPRDELLMAAGIASKIEGWAGWKIISHWLQEEAGRHLHEGVYEQSTWSLMSPEIVALQPSIRMARLINDDLGE